MHKILTVIICIITMTQSYYKTPPQQQQQQNNPLFNIQHKINSLIQQSQIQASMFSISKISYTNLSKIGSKQLLQCVLLQQQQHASTSTYTSISISNRYQLIPSVSIHEGDHISHPAIVKICDSYFTINGFNLASFYHSHSQPTKYRHFYSSVKNQYTYFAEISQNNNENTYTTNVTIKKLKSRNKKTGLDIQTTFSIPLTYGKIVDFQNSFSLSMKLYAFATSNNYLLFYRTDGTLYNVIQLLCQQQQQKKIQSVRPVITRLNNNLAIYSNIFNQYSYLYTVSTNGKNSTLRKFILPIIENRQKQQLQSEIVLKFSDQNWNQFLLKIGTKVYIYEIPKDSSSSDSQTTSNHPKIWYPLLNMNDKFYIAADMLIVQSRLGIDTSQPVTFYYNYNTTSGSSSIFRLPTLECQTQIHMTISSHTQNSEYICIFCGLAYECYLLTSKGSSRSSASAISKLDYTDYSKFRVPLILISLVIVVFISISRGKKGKDNVEEQKQQQIFMKQLQKRDKNLYQQLKKSNNNKIN